MRILHHDTAILVVVKPPGVLAQPDRTGDRDVLTLAKRRLTREQGGGEAPFVGLVHRLDRPTSGLMVLARTSAAARELSRQFREHTAQKQYVALVEGTLQGVGSWTDYIAKLNQQPQIVDPDHEDGRYAALDWQAMWHGANHTLLLIQLHTGRPHQIRLQTASRGHPVVADTRYGAGSSLSEGVIALHHACLRIDHPINPRMETFVADVPPIWSSILDDEAHARIERHLSRAQP